MTGFPDGSGPFACRTVVRVTTPPSPQRPDTPQRGRGAWIRVELVSECPLLTGKLSLPAAVSGVHQASRSNWVSQRGEIPAVLRLSRTRFGVPQSLHVMAGSGETDREGGQCPRIEREKLAFGARA